MLKIGNCHHVWSTVRINVHDNRRAQIKCKLLTGTYILQTNRATFNQYAVNPTCKLCSFTPEIRQQFISECEFLNAERKAYRDRLVASHVITDNRTAQLHDSKFLTQLTLDSSVILNIDDLGKERLGLLELCSREYISKLHGRRIVALKRASGLWPCI